MDNGSQVCFTAALVVAVVIIVWGFMDLLKKQQNTEKTETAVISRQIRGFGMIMLSQVIVIVGTMICFGFGGGLEQVQKFFKRFRAQV